MNINIRPNGAIKRVHVSQNDVGRTLTFELFNNSTSYTIPTGATVKIQGTKPSGFGFSETCTVSGNVVTVDTTEAMTDEFGYIETELSISYNGNKIGTSNFYLVVEKNPHPDTTTDGSMETIIPELTLLVNEVKGYAEEIETTYHAYGSPWVASTVAQMTDTDKIYVYTGSETGYTNGNWYYYNGSSWVSGGVYNSVAVQTDTTLSVSGMPADAKSVGDEVSELSETAYYFDWKKSAMDSGYNAYEQFDWEIGYILNGNNLERTYAMRTKEKEAVDGAMIVHRASTSMSWFYCTYASDGTYISTSATITNTNYTFTPESNKLYRFCVRYVDSSNVMTIKKGREGVTFFNATNIYNPDYYWMNPKVVFSADSQPEFSALSSVKTRVRFRANTSIYLTKSDGRSAANTITFSNDTDFELANNNDVLVWNVVTNEMSVLSSNDLTNKYAVLLRVAYGKMAYGGLANAFLQQREALTTYKYPLYYNNDNYLANKIDAIRSNQKSIGINGDTFIFVTDTHWASNRKESPKLVREIVNETQINKVIHGGDVPSAYQTEAEMYEAVKGDNTAWRYAVGDYLYRLEGNHDIHATDRTDSTNPVYYELTPNEVYGLMMSEQSSRVHYNENYLSGAYFYFDNSVQKIRYICLNNFETPNNPYMSNYQVSWVGDKLLELTAGWSAIVIGHCSIIQAQNADYTHYVDIKGLITAFANKTTFSSSYGRPFDFTDNEASLVGYFCGHKHADMLTEVDGVTYVVTTCDALFQDDGYERTAGTITEQAFDVVSVNTSTKHVDLIRVGAGSNRSFDY